MAHDVKVWLTVGFIVVVVLAALLSAYPADTVKCNIAPLSLTAAGLFMIGLRHDA